MELSYHADDDDMAQHAATYLTAYLEFLHGDWVRDRNLYVARHVFWNPVERQELMRYLTIDRSLDANHAEQYIKYLEIVAEKATKLKQTHFPQ